MKQEEALRLYCQFLVNSQNNFTQTCLSELLGNASHDSFNRFLRLEEVGPDDLWKSVASKLTPSKGGIIVIDDTVLVKKHSTKNELAQRLYSSSEKRVVNGIGVVTCVYVNPKNDESWLVDYRIYNKKNDGKTKINLAIEMLRSLVKEKGLDFQTVLMDKWYSSKELLLAIGDLEKSFYCPLKKNRLLNEKAGDQCKRVDSLDWSEAEEKEGKKGVKLRGFPVERLVSIFRIVASDGEAEYLVTNDDSENSKSVTKIHEIYAQRWKVEQAHRELKQVVGVEKCQCRKARAQRNHIGCSILALTFLKQVACKARTTVYAVKEGIYTSFLKREILHPSLPFQF